MMINLCSDIRIHTGGWVHDGPGTTVGEYTLQQFLTVPEYGQ